MTDNKRRLELELPQDVAMGKYTNFFMITHSSAEFIVDFCALRPGVTKPKVESRVIMAPEHAKRLLLALQDNIIKYERTFGQIKLWNSKQTEEPPTIAPFGHGEA